MGQVVTFTKKQTSTCVYMILNLATYLVIIGLKKRKEGWFSVIEFQNITITLKFLEQV